MTIVDITTRGTLSARIDDDPPGLRDIGLEHSELALGAGSGACEGRRGAVSAVVLSFFGSATLPPDGPATVAKITVTGSIPGVLGESSPAGLFFVDGCQGTG